MSTLITDKVEKDAVHHEKLDTSAYLAHTPGYSFYWYAACLPSGVWQVT
jgi:hypothetical protein